MVKSKIAYCKYCEEMRDEDVNEWDLISTEKGVEAICKNCYSRYKMDQLNFRPITTNVLQYV